MQDQSHIIMFNKPIVHDDIGSFQCNFQIRCWNGYIVSLAGDNSQSGSGITIRHSICVFNHKGHPVTNLCFQELESDTIEKNYATFDDLMRAYNWAIVQQPKNSKQ